MTHPDDDLRYVPPEARPPEVPPAEPAVPPAVGDVPPTPTPSQSSPTPAPRTGNPLLTLVGGAFGCLFVILAGLFLFALSVAGTFNGGLALLQARMVTLLEPAPATARVTSSETIVDRIQPLGRLVSTSAQVARADVAVRVQQGALGVCNHRANHVATATIEAGIDLLRVNADAVRYDAETDTYTLFVPRPTIVGCSIDFIDQYDRQVNGPTCSVDWDDLRQIAQYEALVAFRDEAIEDGLLVTAERDAADALVSFVQALTGSAVVVEFADTSEAVTNPAAACAPEPPRDWETDPLSGEWLRAR